MFAFDDRNVVRVVTGGMMFYQDARRCLGALIGEVEGVGSTQLKTVWMRQGWHRRLTWLRWLRDLREYTEHREVMGLANNLEIERLKAELERLRHIIAATPSVIAELERQRRADGGAQPDLQPFKILHSRMMAFAHETPSGQQTRQKSAREMVEAFAYELKDVIQRASDGGSLQIEKDDHTRVDGDTQASLRHDLPRPATE